MDNVTKGYLLALQSATQELQDAENKAFAGGQDAFAIVEQVNSAKRALALAMKGMPKVRKVTRKPKA